MMKTEYIKEDGCLQRNRVKHKKYAEVYSIERRKAQERNGADLTDVL